MADIARNGIIEIHRGDTATFNVLINLGTIAMPLLYELREKDNLYFAVMEPGKSFEEALIRKKFDYTDFNKETFCVPVRFDTEDTEYLRPGRYYYQVKLRRDASNVDSGLEAVETLIPKTKFIIVD